MAHVKSTARLIGGTVGSGGKDCGSGGSEERTKSARLSDASSRNEAGDVVDGSLSFLFEPSIVTINWVCGMIDIGYFAVVMGHEPREETFPEPHSDEAVIFQEFFSAGLRMPPTPCAC
jgi:hypothetical protein